MWGWGMSGIALDSSAADAPDARAINAAKSHGDFDRFEQAIRAGIPAVSCPVEHRFTPGLYSRQIFMPAGSLITSKIHRTEHQFIVSRGRCRVWNDGQWIDIEAPYHGITRPGTRRLLVIVEDTVWTTFHVTGKTDVDEIEAEIIEPHQEHLAGIIPPEALAAMGDTPCHGSQ